MKNNVLTIHLLTKASESMVLYGDFMGIGNLLPVYISQHWLCDAVNISMVNSTFQHLLLVNHLSWVNLGSQVSVLTPSQWGNDAMK